MAVGNVLVGVLALCAGTSALRPAASGADVAPAAGAKHSWQWEVALDVFEGVTQGFFQTSEFPDLKACAGDMVDMYDDLDGAVSDLETEPIEGVKKALAEIGDALEKGSDAMSQCKDAEAELVKLVSTLKAFKSPWSFVYHVGKDLIVNGKDIYGEINEAEKDWKAQSYRAAGVQVGTALNKLIVGDEKVAMA